MCAIRPFIAVAILSMAAHAAHAEVFHVNVLLDSPDVVPGNGVCGASLSGGEVHGCTLRAAIMEANALGGYIIHLGPGVHLVSHFGPGLHPGLAEDNLQFHFNDGATEHDGINDLDIGVDLEIIGAGEGTTIIEGGRMDRVFHVLNPSRVTNAGPRYVRFTGLTIRNGGTLQNGAGVYVERAGTAVFEDVTIEGNRGAAGNSAIRVDQRGAPRPVARAMDIGAYEFAMPRFTTYPVPTGYTRLHGFIIHLEIRGTGGATFGEIVPAMSNMKLTVQIDQF